MAATLETLPPEILLEVLAYLGPSSLISLSLVSKQLNCLLPTKLLRRPVESLCEKSAISRFLFEVKLRKNGLRQCLLCHGFFLDNETWFLGAAPVCTWHTARFESPVIPRHIDQQTRNRLVARNRPETCWVALNREVCFHCLGIKEWNEPSLDCSRCRDCGRFDVTCLVRVSRVDDPPKSWERSQDGKWMVESDQPDCTPSYLPFVSMA
jgi:hypothetical protein